MDLVRDILVWMVAGADKDRRPAADDHAKFVYHCQLMAEAGLIECVFLGRAGAPSRAIPRRITWSGHDALEVMRNDTFWKKTKAALGERGLPCLIEVAVSVAKGFVSQAGIPLA